MTKYFLFLILLFGSNLYASSNGLIQNEDVKSLNDIKTAVLTTTGNVTFNTTCISSPGSIQNLSIGLFVYDVTNPSFLIPGTTVTGLPGGCSPGQIEFGPVAEGTSTGDTLTFGGSITQLINDSKLYISGAGLDDQLSKLLSENSILNSGSSTPGIISKLFINKSSSTSGFGSGLEIQNYNNTYSGILTDSGGRGFKIATSDYSDSTNTGSVLDLNMGTGTGNTYSSIQAFTAGTSLSNGNLVFNSTGGNVGIGLTNPSASFEVNGAVKFDTLAGTGNRLVKTDATGLLSAGSFVAPAVNGPMTSSYVLTTLDGTVTFDVTAGNLTATLPTAVGISGQQFTIAYVAGTHNLIINTTSSQMIEGRASGAILLGTLYDFITVQSDGANWIIVAKKETALPSTSSYLSSGGGNPFSAFPTGSSIYPTLSGNSLTLTVGTWRLRAKFVLMGSANSSITISLGSPNFVWYSSNGGNTSSFPTALTNYIAYDTAGFNFQLVGAGVGTSLFQAPEYGGIITITSGTQQVFAVPLINVAAPDTGQLSWTVSAERIW